MSKADRNAVGAGAALRAALVDFWYHSVRLVPANVAWGAGLLAVLLVALAGQPLLAAVLAPLLALPLAGIARLAGLIVRGRPAALADAWFEWRRQGLVAVGVGALIVVAAAALITNVIVGLTAGGPAGWVFATLAGWGLAALWALAFPFWVLLGDPARDEWRLADRARLAGLLLLAEPRPIAALAVSLATVLVASTVLFAALLTISVAFAALATAHAVLPMADALVARMPHAFPAAGAARAGRNGD